MTKETNKLFEKAACYKESVDLLMASVVKNCNNYLKQALIENGGSISFHEYDDDGLQLDDNAFSVPYDGGNHPEYASNCFSDIERVYLDGDSIYLEIEDCEEYGIERIDIYTLYDLCEYIHDVILK